MAMVTVRFHRLAEREYQKAFRWYRKRSERAANSFEERMQEAVDDIAANPLQWPAWDDDHRWVSVRGFPFFLYYRILSETAAVVMAVAHGRRRPGYWRRRKE